MEKGLEIKTIVHFNDGYFGRIEIGDHPDAPDNCALIKYIEDNNTIADFLLADEILPELIKALSLYLENKKKLNGS